MSPLKLCQVRNDRCVNTSLEISSYRQGSDWDNDTVQVQVYLNLQIRITSYTTGSFLAQIGPRFGGMFCVSLFFVFN